MGALANYKIDTVTQTINTSSPRCIKTHLPIQFLPDQMWTVKPKIIYIKRNPRDVAVSFYHHYVILHQYKGSLDDFIDFFVGDYPIYSPLFPHYIDFGVAAEKLDNILILNFEDMKKVKFFFLTAQSIYFRLVWN